MRLSEAIRLGAMLHPQCYGRMAFHDGQFNVTATCALGAAAAAGYPVEQIRAGRLDIPTLCPACHQCFSLTGSIAHLNDRHRWTREQIADWVATIEPPDPARTTDPPQARDAVDPQAANRDQPVTRV